MNIRNLWRRAYNEGRFNDIPEEVRDQVVAQLGGKPKPDKKSKEPSWDDLKQVIEEHKEG